MKKQIFEQWLEDHFEKVPDVKVEKYRKKSDGTEYLIDEMVNEYLEYYKNVPDADQIWVEEDMREEELTKIIFSMNEEVLSDLDTGEAPHPMVIGQLLNHNICEFYGTHKVPRNPDISEAEGSLLKIHPVIFNLLAEWLDSFEDFIMWRDSSYEDFWSCFIFDE